MFTLRNRTIIISVVLSAGAVIVVALLGARFTVASPQLAPSSGQPMVTIHVIPIYSVTLAEFGNFTKIGDFATFNVNSSSSVVELTYNGRIRAVSLCKDGWYATFELRVDDTASTVGNVRTEVTNTELGEDLKVIMIGIFNLASGSHNASMWVKCNGTLPQLPLGTFASINPDGWDSTVLIVKEYTPFGYVYMPIIQK